LAVVANQNVLVLTLMDQHVIVPQALAADIQINVTLLVQAQQFFVSA
jgi:hypothetical protein